MFKKILLSIFLLFILVGNHAPIPSKDYSLVHGDYNLQSFHPIDIAFAAEKEPQSSKDPTKMGTFSWASYIVPGAVGIVFLAGIGSYWLVFRKKQLKKGV